MASGKRHQSHVARLLQRVLAELQIEPPALARFLNTSLHQMEAYRTGAERMPTEQQLTFSGFVVARFPQHARLAHRVAAQAHAESAYLAKATETHMNTPPSRFSR
jgi:hypothetical protein